ncbi:copper resistance protein CopC [Microbacterium sp. ARD32]|uniref:copper resistance protein CopC n=1 Tax=Microbacterium sp. ARD32 TaxID=2962577 RepID=UPI0028818486|nr:copper resistance protein CopC [Microbacterium sp. ARD32]MDT0157922.1 copper resistance protein CopC [Microbacterium sp. ARD32]
MFRIRTALAGAAVAVAAMLAVAAPASAHDQLVSSTPADGEQLTSAPEQVVLTFSNDLLALSDNSGTAVTVVDDAGTDWVAGDPVVQADTVTVPLKSGMPGGAYDVTWKVVSSDGHPTSGDYSFSIAASDPAPSTEPSTAPTANDAPSAAPSQSSTPAPAQDASMPWPLLIGLGVVVLIAIILVIVFTARKRRS